MPPYTKLPRPEGHINVSYSPMSPPNWGIVAAEFHYFVYRDVKLALQALLQSLTTIQAQRLEDGSASLFSDYVHYRGQSEFTQRLLPTRLRGTRHELKPRQRFSVANPPKVMFHGQEFPSRSFRGPPGQDPRDHFGDWYEEVKPTRVVEESAAELTEEDLRRRDVRERAAVERAAQLAEVATMDEFQKRAVVRHYTGAPSALLDVSTNPEVAAFFATGGGSQPPPAGQIGMLWAIDLNFLDGIFAFEISDVPNGLTIKSREQREAWGVNKEMFEEHGILPVCPELTFVSLPFRRPLAQHARFFSLNREGGAPLPLLTELTWWSIIERRAAGCAFIQDGRTYENPSHNITRAALLPDSEKLATALA